ncbi:MAG: Ig-like domain-containing protein [Acidimicrobiales bacterium]
MRRTRTSTAALTVVAVLASLVVLVLGADPASAATFSNTTAITTVRPACGAAPNQLTNPYPSVIPVTGLSGTVTDVNVTLSGISNDWGGDLEIVLSSPDGTRNLVLLSDAAATTVSGFTVTLDDSAPALVPQNSLPTTASARPADYLELVGSGAPADTYPGVPTPLSKPAPTGTSTLASVFNGATANGNWKLYVLNDACDAPDETLTGGWTLDITASATAAATTTAVTSSLNPSRTGQSVTETATVTSGGNPVNNTGTVTFTEGTTVLASNVPVDASGHATYTTSTLPEGNHVITASYNGTASFNTSNGSIDQRVDNNTVVNGSTYCNAGSIAVRPGSAVPYPSNIFVTGFSGTLGQVTATLKNVTHQFPEDIDVLLVSPAGQALVLVSDAGNGFAAVSNVSVTLDDAAAGMIPGAGAWAAPNAAATYRPTDYQPAGELDSFPGAPGTFGEPAPTGTATLASVFNGSNPNGTWRLYVRDDGAPDTGAIAGGWCVTLTPAKASPSLSTQASAGVAVGGQVSDSATLVGGVSPTGSITFKLFGPNDSSCLNPAVFTSAAVTVTGNASYGSGSFTPTLVGTYRWTAAYSGDGNNNAATSGCNAPNESVAVSAASPSLSTVASGVAAGGQVSDTATLAGGVSPTGSITFKLFGPNDSSCSNPAVFTSAAVTVTGNASYSSGPFTPTAAGIYRWTAAYSGDGNNNPASSGCNAPNESVTVTKPTPTVATQASPGVVLGAPVRDTATLTGGASPTGTVTFTLFSDAGCSAAVFTSTNPVSGGTATSGYFTPAAAGTYYWVAAYNGDGANGSAGAPCGAPNESVVVQPFTGPQPTQTITGDSGPVTVNAGQSVLISGGRVVGGVTVNPGGALTVVNSQIRGSITASSPAFFSLCGVQVSVSAPAPALTVSNAAVPIRVGDPANGCARNTFGGPVNITGNLAVTFVGNIVYGAATVNNNGPGSTIVGGNTIYVGTLSCTGNNPPPTNAGQSNTAPSKTGQCATL